MKTYINTKDKLQKISTYSNKALTKLNLSSSDIDLVWDGGNLVSNGRLGFITEKILTDNPDYSKTEILSRIEYALNIKPIIVPKCLNDTLGHIDGYASFIEEDKLCISSYPDKDYLKSENEYLFRLREIAREENLEIIDIQDYPVDEKCRVGGESIESAKGCYVNFLKLNNIIILPEFKLGRGRSGDYNRVNREMLQEMGYDVRTIDCTELSELGGVLHCISWEW